MFGALSLYDLAAVRAQSAAGVLVFGDTPPDVTTRDRAYLIVDPDPGFDEVSRAGGGASSRRGRFHIRCCGSSKRQALFALDRCRETFLDWHPFPDDRRYPAVRESDAGPAIEDKSVPTDIRWSFTLTYDLDDD